METAAMVVQTSGAVALGLQVILFNWVLWTEVFPTLVHHKGRIGLMRGMGYVMTTYVQVCREHGAFTRGYRFLRVTHKLGLPLVIWCLGAGELLRGLTGDDGNRGQVAAGALLLAMGALIFSWSKSHSPFEP